jgi:MFS family permease
MYDRFGLRVTVGTSTVTGIAVMIALSMITATPAGIVLAFFYGVFSSLALPLETVMLPIFANDLFGERSYNKMLGIIVSVNTAGFAAGALFMNTCYDLLGTYKAGLLVCAGIMLFIACAIQLAIGLAHKERRAVQEREQMAQNAE